MEIIENFDMLDEQSKHALRDLKDGKETIWRNSEKESSTAISEQAEFKTWWFAPLHRDPGAPFSPADPVRIGAVTSIADAERRLQRFAPFIKELFKEDETLQKSNGIIESPLVRVAAMQRRVEEDLGTRSAATSTSSANAISPSLAPSKRAAGFMRCSNTQRHSR